MIKVKLSFDNDFILVLFKSLMHNFPKWSDTLYKSCGKLCKIFKRCLTILGSYAGKS